MRQKVAILFLANLITVLTAGAATITVTTSQNLSALSATSIDDIVVNVGGTVTVNVNDTVRSVTVAGGTWSSSGGHKITTDAFWMSSGAWNAGAADSIEPRNLNVLGTDEIYVTGGTCNWNGTASQPVIIRTNPTSGGGSVKFSGAGAILRLAYPKFVNMTDPAGNLFTGGVTFQSRTTATSTTIIGMIADSCQVTSYTCTGLKWDGGRLFAPNGTIGMESWLSTADSVVGVSVSTYGSHGIYCHSDNCYYKKDTVVDRIDFDDGTYKGNFDLDGATSPKIDSCIIGGKVQGGILFAGGGATNPLIQFNRIYSATHEQIHSDATTLTGLTLQGNFIYGGGARGLLTLAYSHNLSDAKLYYNTVVSWGGGTRKGVIDFGCIAGTGCGVTVSNLDFVGNIFLCSSGTAGDINIDGGTNVTCTRFSYNLFHEIDTSKAGAHFGVPSNEWVTNLLSNQAGFVDSINANFSLVANSPVINQGEGAIFLQVFGASHSSDAPGDIGASQTFTGGTAGGGDGNTKRVLVR